MLSRKDSHFLIDLPNEWVDKVSELLQDAYRTQLTDRGQDFAVFGRLYKGEIVVITSLIEPGNELAAPTSYFVSMDLADGQDHTKLLDTLVDSVGAFFDTFFGTPDWSDYQDIWKEEEWKGLTVHCKITRENVKATIDADRLLNQ